MRRWRRFRRLAAPEKKALLQALILVPVTGVALRLAGLRRWKAVLARLAPRIPSTGVINPETPDPEIVDPEIVESARRAARMVDAAAREGVYHGKCLEKSLVLWWLLLRRRLPAEIHIGVRKGDAGFEAHAWVELFKMAINDGEGLRQDYVPFDRDVAALGIEPH